MTDIVIMRWRLQEANAAAEAEQEVQRQVQPQLRLGQRVIHKPTDMQGVVVGWDRACCEGAEWRSVNETSSLQRVGCALLAACWPVPYLVVFTACDATKRAAACTHSITAPDCCARHVAQLCLCLRATCRIRMGLCARATQGGHVQGDDQPFYHVAIDVRDWREAELPRDNQAHVPTCYLPEEQLDYPELRETTWKEEHAADDKSEFRHPYEYVLFLGKDHAGDFIPSPELRNAYGTARRDVYPADQNGSGAQGNEDSGPREGGAGGATGDESTDNY